MVRTRAAFLAAVLLSIFVVGEGRMKQMADGMEEEIRQRLLDEIQGENIKANLRALTKEPHQAGTKANERVAKTIEKMYTDAGLEKVHTLTYDVLLSYPKWERPNTVSIKNKDGKALFTSKGVTTPIIPEEQGAPHAGHQWLAYSAPGVVEGDVVYAHSGTADDFAALFQMGIDVKGKIALMRYGQSFRGNKVAEAQAAGARAAILFSDPAEVAQGNRDDVYPKSVWMPPEGVQRGFIMNGHGDPLTPLYPAKPGAFKSRTIDEAKEEKILPSIPALPISYETAYEILSRMDGKSVPSNWQGGINVTYRLGPGLRDGCKTVVDVKSTLETRQVHNVVGYIPGHEEEDRYVILGNHFDAWVYGSIDPNSGTAILAEVARSMVELTKTTSWKPARSIVFVALDAEEYGLIGSTEFVEEFVMQLGGRAVAYINMDCFQGNHTLDANAVPSLIDVVIDVAKRIPNHVEEEVKAGRKTLYDTWVRMNPGSVDGEPDIKPLVGGTDHVPFLTFAGVPTVDFRMENVTRKSYPLYHSLFETPFVNEHLYDKPDFGMHRSIGRYWAELARTLADAPLLPFNVTRSAHEILTNYVVHVKNYLVLLKDNPGLEEAKAQAGLLEKASEKYLYRAQQFSEHALKVRDDERKLRAANERIMMTERCFLNPRGAPGAPQNRHVLYSISEKDTYAGRTMAAFYDSIHVYLESKDKAKAGRAVAEEISIIFHAVHCASITLKPFL